MENMNLVWKVNKSVCVCKQGNKHLSSLNMGSEFKSVHRLLYIDLDSLWPQSENMYVSNKFFFVMYVLLGK